MALGGVGVAAALAVAFGQPVKGQEQTLPPPFLRAVLAHALGKRIEISGMPVIVADKARKHLPASVPERFADRQLGRAAGGFRALGIERQDHELLDSRPVQGVEGVRDGRAAVAHPECDRHRGLATFRQGPLQRPKLALRVHRQGRASLGPDRAIGAGAAGRPEPQDHAVQDREPEPSRQLDHFRIGEELAQIAPDGSRVRRVGGAEVAEQDTETGKMRHARKIALFGFRIHNAQRTPGRSSTWNGTPDDDICRGEGRWQTSDEQRGPPGTAFPLPRRPRLGGGGARLSARARPRAP